MRFESKGRSDRRFGDVKNQSVTRSMDRKVVEALNHCGPGHTPRGKLNFAEKAYDSHSAEFLTGATTTSPTIRWSTNSPSDQPINLVSMGVKAVIAGLIDTPLTRHREG